MTIVIRDIYIYFVPFTQRRIVNSEGDMNCNHSKYAPTTVERLMTRVTNGRKFLLNLHFV
jgi:hypothetical protein